MTRPHDSGDAARREGAEQPGVAGAAIASPRRGALVLIVEDEPRIADIVRAYFERAGYQTVCAADGPAGVQHHRRLSPDLVILDVKLPKSDGWEVLADIRRTADTPVIMVTALGDDADRLAGFRGGADDYVVKPFNPAELIERAAAVLRRAQRLPRARVMRLSVLEIDLDRHVARVVLPTGRHVLDLTSTQFRLLRHLVDVAPRVVERGELLEACLPEGDALERTVDSHLSKLRRRLEDAGAGDLLQSVRGVGYRLAI